jgi:hypothetical protein
LVSGIIAFTRVKYQVILVVPRPRELGHQASDSDRVTIVFNAVALVVGIAEKIMGIDERIRIEGRTGASETFMPIAFKPIVSHQGPPF